MALRLCKIAQLFYSPIRNTFSRISLHDLQYHRTMKIHLRQVSLNMVAFLLLLQRSWIQTNLFNCIQYPCLFDILIECNPMKHGRGMMLVLPNQLVSWVFSMLDYCSAFSQTVLKTPNTLIRSPFFFGYQSSIPNLEPFPNRILSGFSQIAVPTTVLPMDDRTDFAQEERLDLPYWTMI